MQSKDVQEQMFTLIRGWQHSGLSQKMYCEQKGIRYHVFHYWFKRFRNDQPDQTKEFFTPVHVKPSQLSGTNAGIELILADGRRVLFHQLVSADFIKVIIG